MYFLTLYIYVEIRFNFIFNLSPNLF